MEGRPQSRGGHRTGGPRGRGLGPRGLRDCMPGGLRAEAPGTLGSGILKRSGSPGAGPRLGSPGGVAGSEGRSGSPELGLLGLVQLRRRWDGLACPFGVSFGGDSLAWLRPAGDCTFQNPRLKTKTLEPALQRGPQGSQNEEGVSKDRVPKLGRGGGWGGGVEGKGGPAKSNFWKLCLPSSWTTPD